MLCLKYIFVILYNNGYCNSRSNKKKKALQAWPVKRCLQKKSRVSCFASCRASVTVEASLIFPLFLCAVCTFVGMGQMMLAETEIKYAVSQTAKICASREAVRMKEGTGNAAGTVSGNVFFSVYDGGSLCENVISGGKSGIKVSVRKGEGQEIRVEAVYVLRMPVPFFQGLCSVHKAMGVSRIYSGYVAHGAEDFFDGNRIVYVAEYGEVYHTSPNCSHICITITDHEKIEQMISSPAWHPCEKCMKNGIQPDVIYMTEYGDCYHSSLSCSGLKRTIKAVRLSEVSNLALCSRCAKNTGGDGSEK
ncbi:MAG: hypothetical protein PUH29_02730 [Lachnospiraceae bacterium]|nr:hypothetical protein [Lachnospiraceae bacterium]MDY5496612.1 hypothetical protein [Anaerobutyricum sp.]